MRWLNDDPAIATMMNLEQLRAWMHRPQSELYAALPKGFIADWD